MPQIDGSIAASAKAPQVDPLGAIQGLTALQSTLLQNRLLGQQIAGKSAMGKAVLAHTKPDGSLDQAGFVEALKADPDAAMSGAEGVQFGQEQRQAQIEQATAELQRQYAAGNLTTQQLEQSAKENKNGSDLAFSLISNRDKVPLTKDAVGDTILGAIADGRIATPQGRRHAAEIVGKLTDDPKANEALLNNLYLQGNSTLEAIEAVRGRVQMVDTGADIEPTRVDPVTGVASTAGAPIPKTLPPTIVNGVNPLTGAPTAVEVGGARDGRYPAAKTPGAPAGALVETGLAPGAADTLEASAKVYQDDIAAVPTVRKAITAFDQAATALAGARTGKGSDVAQNLGAVAVYIGLPIPDSWKSGVVSYAEADKWLSSAVAQEAGRLGLNTDASRDLQERAQPSTKTPQAAALAMLPVLKGLKAMDLAAPVIAQKQGITPQKYSAWRAQWANSVDPLAFSAPSMSAAERKKMGDKMTAADRARYLAGVQAAIDAGVYSKADLAK